MIAAYAIVLHSVLGGIVLAQQSALAQGSGIVICYGSDDSGGNGDTKASLRHVPCGLCAAAGSIAPPPEEISLPLPETHARFAHVIAPDQMPPFARLISPRLSQGPPYTA